MANPFEPGNLLGRRAAAVAAGRGMMKSIHMRVLTCSTTALGRAKSFSQPGAAVLNHSHNRGRLAIRGPCRFLVPFLALLMSNRSRPAVGRFQPRVAVMSIHASNPERLFLRYREEAFPQGLNPRRFCGLCGTAEAAPFQSHSTPTANLH